ncbi:MAG TPA: ribose 5-phosphate isomerase B [Bacteroidota bacterium]|nr:ribose 5-phosphate isomerase B [Bacteroidota bacterium]
MSRKLITEQSILEAAKRGETSVSAGDGAIVTAAAKDRAAALGITIGKPSVKKNTSEAAAPPSPGGGKGETIALGSDHGGFAMKEQLKSILESQGFHVVDVGTYSEESCDYPEFAYAVAKMVSLGDAAHGIMIDSVGIASAIVANKLRGIRAACCTDEFMARSSREHNNANVLTLGGKTLGIETAKGIVKAWIETPFGGGRHQKRIEKIADIENRSKS